MTIMNKEEKGHIHPITHTINEIVDVFVDMGFEVATGPEMEDEYHNFDALNVPKDHPARDMQDTFWLKGISKLLRTHTSNVQARFGKEHGAPFKIVAPGKVYRYEATDRTHEVQFHQVEGMVVGKDINLGHLKKALLTFLRKVFGEDVDIQLRPGFFPFVEPGIEVDMKCFRCKGEGCATCSHSGWIEILGAGMTHPNVLNLAGINPNEYQGFAFGIGVDRVAMLKYGIEDVRQMYNGDLRIVNQF